MPKLRLYGNIQNRMAECANTHVIPEVGMGVTVNMYTDRHAATIIRVISPTRIEIQEDKAKLIFGSRQSESQEYEFERNPKGNKFVYSRRKSGLWMKSGDRNGNALTLNHRDEYYDPCF